MKRHCWVLLSFVLYLLVPQSPLMAQTEIDSMRVTVYDYVIDSTGAKLEYIQEVLFETCDSNEHISKTYRYNSARELTSYFYSYTSRINQEHIEISWDKEVNLAMVEFYYEKYLSTTATYKKLEIVWENYGVPKTTSGDTILSRNIKSRNDIDYYSSAPDPVYLFNDTNRIVAQTNLEMIDFSQPVALDDRLIVQSFYTFEEPFITFFEALKGQTGYDRSIINEWVEKTTAQMFSDANKDESKAMIVLEDKLTIFEVAPFNLYAVTDKKRPSHLKRNKRCKRMVNEKNYERWDNRIEGLDPYLVHEVWR